MDPSPPLGIVARAEPELVDDLIGVVARSADLPPDQAEAAVRAILRFMAARLPSPLFGELQSHLRSTATRRGQGVLTS